MNNLYKKHIESDIKIHLLIHVISFLIIFIVLIETFNVLFSDRTFFAEKPLLQYGLTTIIYAVLKYFMLKREQKKKRSKIEN